MSLNERQFTLDGDPGLSTHYLILQRRLLVCHHLSFKGNGPLPDHRQALKNANVTRESNRALGMEGTISRYGSLQEGAVRDVFQEINHLASSRTKWWTI